MLTPENRAVVDRYWNDFIGKKDFAAAPAIFADDFVLHDPLSPTPVPGRDTLVEMLTELFRSFSDIVYTREEDIAEPNKVVIRWTMTGTQSGSFLGLPPTGKRVRMSGVDMLYLAAGRIHTLRLEANLLGLVHQLGAVPQLTISC